MTYSPVLWIILYLAVSCPFSVSAQTEQEQRIHEIDQHIMQLEQNLGMELPPGERRGLEHELERLQVERKDLEEFLKRHESDREKQPHEPDQNETGQKAAESEENVFKNAVVLAALITTLGGIIVALIGLIKSKRN